MPNLVRPYVNQTVHLRYSREDPPSPEPPAELRLDNPHLWRVWHRVWVAHPPDASGKRCANPECRRWYPCPPVIDADGGFCVIIRHAQLRLMHGDPAIGIAPVWYPSNRNV